LDAKTEISANGTYVLDPEDVEQLDELSLTSVITDVVKASAQPSPKSSDAAASGAEGDTTINEILRGAPATTVQPPATVPRRAEPSESTGDLVAPELIFDDVTQRRR
jgi:hypothetical protein